MPTRSTTPTTLRRRLPKAHNTHQWHRLDTTQTTSHRQHCDELHWSNTRYDDGTPNHSGYMDNNRVSTVYDMHLRGSDMIGYLNIVRHQIIKSSLYLPMSSGSTKVLRFCIKQVLPTHWYITPRESSRGNN